MKWARLSLMAVIVAGAAVATVVLLVSNRERQLEKKVSALEQERAQLITYVERLSASTRVAQVDVLAQTRDASGCTVTSLLWREIGADGTMGRPLQFDVSGRTVYFEALVLKFDHDLVEAGDVARGASLALFRRAFGDQQAPESGVALDAAAPPPAAGEMAADVRARLWARFWDFVENPRLAREYRVRIAQIEAPAAPVKPGQIWEVSLDASGGLNLRKVAEAGGNGAGVTPR